METTLMGLLPGDRAGWDVIAGGEPTTIIKPDRGTITLSEGARVHLRSDRNRLSLSVDVNKSISHDTFDEALW